VPQREESINKVRADIARATSHQNAHADISRYLRSEEHPKCLGMET